MKAITFRGKLALEANYPDPKPAEGECIVRVHYAGISGIDLQILRGQQTFQGVLGHEFVGRVVRGSAVWRDKRVVGEINCVCRKCSMCLSGLSNHCRKRTVLGMVGRDGCFAETLSIPERNLHTVPEIMTDEQAVFVEPLAAAYQILAQCRIEPRMTVTVLGVGRLGNLVAQVLAGTGCKLSVVGRNPRKLELCEKRGIQAISLPDLAPQSDRDVVVDCTGSPDGLKLAASLVRPRGTIVLKGVSAQPGPTDLAPLVANEVTLIGSRCGPFPEALHALARSAVDVRPLITRIYPIEQALDAFAAASHPEAMKILLRINPR